MTPLTLIFFHVSITINPSVQPVSNVIKTSTLCRPKYWYREYKIYTISIGMTERPDNNSEFLRYIYPTSMGYRRSKRSYTLLFHCLSYRDFDIWKSLKYIIGNHSRYVRISDPIRIPVAYYCSMTSDIFKIGLYTG